MPSVISKYPTREAFPQSRQRAKLFFQSSELGPPAPLPAGECVPHPGGAQLGRGDRHCGTLRIQYMYFVGYPLKKINPYLVGTHTFSYESLISRLFIL
jgi:hypothetical protein